MSHPRTWLTAGVVALVLAAGIAVWQLRRDASRGVVAASDRAAATISAGPRDTASAEAAAESGGAATSPYHASDPARLAATGRPQLVEFYHRL